MKKQLIVSMIAVATAMSFVTQANAAGAVKATAKEALVDYIGKVKEHSFGPSRSAKGLEAQKAKSLQDMFIKSLGLDSMSNQLSLALADGAKSSQRFEALAAVYAVKAMSENVSKTDAAEGKSMSESAEVFAKLIANSGLTGAKKTSKELDAKQLSDVSVSLEKAEALSEVVITKFEKADRDSWTQIFKRHAEVLEQGGKSSEEALVIAVMDVKKVTKEQAIEILRKLKECV